MKRTVFGRTRLTTLVTAGMAVALTLAGCGGGTSGSGSTQSQSIDDMDPVTLKVATLYGPDNWQTTPLVDYTKAVEEKSKGKIKFDFYYGAALLKPGEIVDGLSDGLADLAYFVPVYTPAKFPIDDWISKLAFLSDPDPVVGNLQALGAVAEWGMNNEDYTKEIEGQGLKTLVPRVQVIQKYNLLCKEPVTTLAEAKGKRVRVGGDAWAAQAKNIGMVPVSVTGEEIYTAFQRGIFDCFMGGVTDMESLKITEIGKNYTSTGFTGFSSYALALGADKWGSLPLAAQQLLWDEIPTYLEAFASSNFEAVIGFTEIAEKLDVKTLTADDELLQAVQSYHDEVLASLAKDAPSEISDAQGAIDEFVSGHEKWLTIVKDLGYEGSSQNMRDIDLQPWVDKLWSEVFEPNRPE